MPTPPCISSLYIHPICSELMVYSVYVVDSLAKLKIITGDDSTI